MRMFTTAVILVAALAGSAAAAEESKVFRADHVIVTYTGIDAKYAEAIARTVEAARAAAVADFGFDMPQTVQVTVTADPKAAVRLFNDGDAGLVLTVRGQKDLAKPADSGTYEIYGLCHEIGHLAMYRIIPDHSWCTVAAVEGWAHYVGSCLVDRVYQREGKNLWPDAYDYLADGTQRLDKQLARPDPGETALGAGQWKALAAILGEKGLQPVLKAWGKVKVDPADPAAALRPALLATKKDEPRLAEWWAKAESLLVQKRPASDVAAVQAKPNDLANHPQQLAHDDGTAAGKGSLAGGGHAVKFQVKGPAWYLTEVSIYGSRYGMPQAPQENFHVWLCDKDFRAIADFPFPYSAFERGDAKWVTLKVMPTLVPPDFIICVGFNPTASKGVFVSRDKASDGNSLTGLPGTPGNPIKESNWMIRATVDQLKSADALRDVRP